MPQYTSKRRLSSVVGCSWKSICSRQAVSRQATLAAGYTACLHRQLWLIASCELQVKLHRLLSRCAACQIHRQPSAPRCPRC